MPNKKETFKKLISLVLGVMIISLALSFWVVAWTEPGQPPTDGNVAAPINIGNIGQTKTGWLATLGGLLVGFESALGDPPTGVLQVLNGALINTNGAPTGLIVAEGKVGIGTSTVSDGFRMEVKGNIKLSDDPAIPGTADFTIKNVKTPVDNSDVATKEYVDVFCSSCGGCNARLKFAGYTGSAFFGNLGGPFGAAQKCSQAFPSLNTPENHVHWCSVDELIELRGKYPYTYPVWVRGAVLDVYYVGLPEYVYKTVYSGAGVVNTNLDEDDSTCQAWLSSSGSFVGPYLNDSGSGGELGVKACNQALRLACCYYGN